MKPLWMVASAAVVLSTPFALGQVKISQVWGGGGAGSPFDRDYVELHNPTSSPFDLTGWSVQYLDSTEVGTWSFTPLSGTVPAGGYFLIGEATTSATTPTLPAVDASGTIEMTAYAGKVALCNTTTPMAGIVPPPGVVVDLVGYGTSANLREPIVGGTLANNAPLPGNAVAAFRRGGGATDTDDNAADFAIGFPSPRNSATLQNGGLTGIGFASPHVLEPGMTTRIVVTPRQCATEGTVSTSTAVTADLSSIGGSPGAALFDDGTNGDEVAGDGLYSLLATVGPATAPGTRSLPLGFTAGAAQGGAWVSILVTASSSPDNDNCATASFVAAPYNPPVQVAGTFAGANSEYNPFSMSPGITTASARGVWYRVTGTGFTMTASTCPVAFDTMIAVMCGTCDGLNVVAANDNPTQAVCPAAPAAASASWCSTSGVDYLIWVGPAQAGPQTAAFTLTIADVGVACVGSVPCPGCSAPSTIGATIETERGFGVGINDGCDSTANGFVDVTLAPNVPQTIVGTSRGYHDVRDVDWYRFLAPATGTITASLTAHFRANIGLRYLGATGTCAFYVPLSNAFSGACQPVTVSAAVTAGTWYAVRILHAPLPTTYGGVAPGGASYHYQLGLNLCQATGCPACQTTATSATVAPGCSPLGGNIPSLVVTPPSLCTNVFITVTGAPAGAAGFLAVGNPASIPIPGCVVSVDFLTAPFVFPIACDPAGSWWTAAYLPDLPALQGALFRVQGGLILPAEYRLTNCQQVVINY
jgi:Lamin Tail Domain